VSKENIQTEWSKFGILVDTTKTFRVEIDKTKLKITETIKITEYDKETGKPTKETEAKRETTQDSDKVVAEEENQAITNSNQLEIEHNADISNMIDSEVKEESIGGQESFGKWFGIVFGVIVGLLLLYLLRKFRVS
jgi:tetrahydromethanopterin S-methyltransferase subunit G